MPRTPTERPRGRPPGTGILGEQTRLTVRIPAPLYARLEAFAAGRHFYRGSPQLARCVREALAEYLDRHSKRQTENMPLPSVDQQRQTRKTAAEFLETPGTLADASIDAAKDRWTTPREATPPRKDAAPPALQTVGETWSRQAVVALILRWREEGMTKTAIATRLNAAPVPLLAGTGNWNIQKVNRALLAVPKSTRARQAFLARYAPPSAAALGCEVQA